MDCRCSISRRGRNTRPSLTILLRVARDRRARVPIFNGVCPKQLANKFACFVGSASLYCRLSAQTEFGAGTGWHPGRLQHFSKPFHAASCLEAAIAGSDSSHALALDFGINVLPPAFTALISPLLIRSYAKVRPTCAHAQNAEIVNAPSESIMGGSPLNSPEPGRGCPNNFERERNSGRSI